LGLPAHPYAHESKTSVVRRVIVKVDFHGRRKHQSTAQLAACLSLEWESCWTRQHGEPQDCWDAAAQRKQQQRGAGTEPAEARRAKGKDRIIKDRERGIAAAAHIKEKEGRRG
jgi:hypothetical protein